MIDHIVMASNQFKSNSATREKTMKTFKYKLAGQHIPDVARPHLASFNDNACMLYYGTVHLFKKVSHHDLIEDGHSYYRTEPLLD
jgi:hypothetical protein